MNGFDASLKQFRGGAGWVSAGWRIAASSRCPVHTADGGHCKDLNIRFGVGQASKTTAAGAGTASVSHAVQAPFGDVPFVVSQVNVSVSAAALAASSNPPAYTEVWSTLAQELLPTGWNTEASRTWGHNVSASCVTRSTARGVLQTTDEGGLPASGGFVLTPALVGSFAPCPADSLALLLFDEITAPS